MKTLEESIAAAMDVKQDTAIILYLPYIRRLLRSVNSPIETPYRYRNRNHMSSGMSALFDNYIQNQATENEALDNNLSSSTMVLKKIEQVRK